MEDRRAMCRITVIMVAAVLLGCSEGGVTPPPDAGTASITRPSIVAMVGASVAIAGSVSGGAVWSVNGVPGGGPVVGTITAGGVYTAPLLVPRPNPVQIRIASASNPADSASTFLAVTPGPLVGDWLAWQPRIISAASTDFISLVVHAGPGVDRVELATGGSGGTLQFRRVTGQLFQLDLPPALATTGYVVGDYHRFVGFIDHYTGGNRSRRNGFVNVRDATVPVVKLTALTEDAVRTPHVLNLMVDEIGATGAPELAAIRRFFQFLPDAYDFIAVVQPLTYFQNRSYAGLRNATQGVGRPIHDSGATWGSPSRLLGFIRYPIDFFFDLGEQAANHEIGHQWINFLSGTPLATGIPHWPYSSLGSGVMGISIGSTGVGGHFPNVFELIPEGGYRVVAARDTGVFNDLELYLMGLLPPDSVAPHIVFHDQAQFPLAAGMIASGPVTTVTVEQIIDTHGPRDPAPADSPREFRLATIVLSVGRLLGPDELAFFDHMAARGEATERLRYTSGFASGMSHPFFLATGGRARLVTRLD
jgi:hypothetical protein